MQAVLTTMYMLLAIEILVLPILLIVWIIRKAQKKPKMKWIKWFWTSFGVFLLAAVLTNPSTWCQHEYKLTENKEASCTENGYEKFHCNLCGGDKKEIVKKLGHSMADVWRVEPTDDKDGEYVQRCTRCGYEKVEVLPSAKGKTETITVTQIEPTYSPKAESFAKKYKVPVELMGSLEEAMAKTDFLYSFEEMDGLERTDDWAGGTRYRVWHYAVKEDKYYTILVYEKHNAVSALFDITDGRELIYSAPDEHRSSDTEDNGILLVEGIAGAYGKEVTASWGTYYWYMVPTGTYTMENQLKIANVFIVADNNSDDVRQTVQFDEAGQTQKIVVEEGTHIELSMQTEVLLTPMEE